MGLKIEEARVIVCCPGRNFVTLKIITNEGIYGLGDATLNGRGTSINISVHARVATCVSLSSEEDKKHTDRLGSLCAGGGRA